MGILGTNCPYGNPNCPKCENAERETSARLEACADNGNSNNGGNSVNMNRSRIEPLTHANNQNAATFSQSNGNGKTRPMRQGNTFSAFNINIGDT